MSNPRPPRRFYRSVFPPRISLPNEERALLETLFPQIDWAATPCYGELPWFAQTGFAIAMALPATLHPSRTQIHFLYPIPQDIYARTTILVHEAFHIQQYRDLCNPWADLGYFRRFTRYYFGWFIAGLVQNWRKYKTWNEVYYHTYRQHPLEVPAYDYEYAFARCYGVYRAGGAGALATAHPELICRHSGKVVRPPWWAWLLASLAVLAIAQIKPLSDLFLKIVALILGK